MTNYQLPHNVLVIAYYFPPLGLSGVQRTLKFVKYLPQYGWNPTVLTVEARGYFAKDEGLLHEIEGLPVEIVRTHSIDPLHFFRKFDIVKMPSARVHSRMSKLSQYFFIPDNKIGWKKKALEIAREILSKKKFDVIFATAPPYTSFLIGTQLKKEFRIPLVVDYRDPWLKNPLHFYLTPLHRIVHRKLEAYTLRHADHVITINRIIKEQIIREYPNITHHGISIIQQGYDEEDFKPYRSDVQTKRPTLRITHAGTFYFNRTPKYLLLSLKSFFEIEPTAKQNIQVSFIGNFRSEDVQLIQTLGLQNNVILHGYLPHDQCIKELMDSDVLFMMLGKGVGVEIASTGKLYEYFGARKTILASVPDGAAKQILIQAGGAFITSPDNVVEITKALHDIYQSFKNDSLPKPKKEFVENFDRQKLTQELSKIFSWHLPSTHGIEDSI